MKLGVATVKFSFNWSSTVVLLLTLAVSYYWALSAHVPNVTVIQCCAPKKNLFRIHPKEQHIVFHAVQVVNQFFHYLLACSLQIPLLFNLVEWSILLCFTTLLRSGKELRETRSIKLVSCHSWWLILKREKNAAFRYSIATDSHLTLSTWQMSLLCQVWLYIFSLLKFAVQAICNLSIF